MKLQDALNVIERKEQEKNAGFMVHFERTGNGVLCSDYFPDVRNGEKPIATEKDAWDLANKFASATRYRCVNVYVINAVTYVPVDGYADKMIINR
jgi:hypothetical protein